MDKEAQRIAIAEWCGWKMANDHCLVGYFQPTPFMDSPQETIPDYLNDLNAMWEVESKAPLSYWGTLAEVVGFGVMSIHQQNYRLIAHATAAQRAEALLRTIGKWQDNPTPVLVGGVEKGKG